MRQRLQLYAVKSRLRTNGTTIGLSQDYLGCCHPMDPPDLTETSGGTEAIDITRDVCKRDMGFDRSFLARLDVTQVRDRT